LGTIRDEEARRGGLPLLTANETAVKYGGDIIYTP
jgi:hypothetical protein